MKRVLVLGSQGALGRSVCDAILKTKHELLCCDVASAGPETNADYKQISPSVSLPEYQEALLSFVRDRKLDAVVNVAGGWAGGGIASAGTAAAVEEMMRQSVFSSVAAAHVFATRGNEGSLLVLTGAEAARGPTPGMLGYGMAKSAVHFLCRSLAADPTCLPLRSTAVALLPVTLDTPSNRGAMPDADHASWTPLNVIGEKVVEWCNGVDVPPSGSLVSIKTAAGKTSFSIE